jgi:hypothetical protein
VRKTSYWSIPLFGSSNHCRSSHFALARMAAFRKVGGWLLPINLAKLTQGRLVKKEKARFQYRGQSGCSFLPNFHSRQTHVYNCDCAEHVKPLQVVEERWSSIPLPLSLCIG